MMYVLLTVVFCVAVAWSLHSIRDLTPEERRATIPTFDDEVDMFVLLHASSLK